MNLLKRSYDFHSFIPFMGCITLTDVREVEPSLSPRDSSWFKIFLLNNFSATQERMLEFWVMRSWCLEEGEYICSCP